MKFHSILPNHGLTFRAWFSKPMEILHQFLFVHVHLCVYFIVPCCLSSLLSRTMFWIQKEQLHFSPMNFMTSVGVITEMDYQRAFSFNVGSIEAYQSLLFLYGPFPNC